MSFLINPSSQFITDHLRPDHHSSLINFCTALGYKDLEIGMCFGLERMGTQAVCVGELDEFNNRVMRIHSLSIKNLGSYPEVVSNLKRELSEAITQRDTLRIESAVDLMAFAECAAVAQKPEAYSYLIDERNEMKDSERLLKLKELTYSKKLKALGGLETIGIAIDQYSVETFEKYITELKTIAKRASVEFLILQLEAEQHVVTIIYSPNEQCWYCIDANNLPIQQNRSDQAVSKWVFERYNLFYYLSKKRLLISTNLQLLGKDLKCSEAFQNWRENQKKNRLLNLTPQEINQRNNYDTAPLQAVAKLERLSGSSYAPMLCSLLDRGADPNYADKSSVTPLIYAVKEEDVDAVKVLLAHGADPNIKTKDGCTALMLASVYGNSETVNALLKAGADLGVKTKDNWTALMLASGYGNSEIVKALLEKGADPNIKTKDGWTALMLASVYGNSETVNALLEKGADPHVKTRDNWTALMVASRYGNSEMVKALLEKGADPNIKTKDGWTALGLAKGLGDTGKVEALLTAAAN